MNYKILGLAFSFLGISLSNAASNPKIYSFEDSDLSEQRFINGLNDLTEDNYAYCAWAVKKNFRYYSLQDADGYYPLEILVYLGARLDKADLDKRERFKKLWEILLKCGADFVADSESRLNVDDLVEVPDLKAIGLTYETLRKQLPLAFKAVRDKDIHALDELLKPTGNTNDIPYSMLVEMYCPFEGKTLLHAAAEQFVANDAKSVQMFAHLIRKGADVDMPDAKGESVARIMNKGIHNASELYKNEKAGLQKKSLPSVRELTARAKKFLNPAYQKIRPYRMYLAGGIGLIGVLLYLMRSGSDKGLQAQPNNVAQLQQLQ